MREKAPALSSRGKNSREKEREAHSSTGAAAADSFDRKQAAETRARLAAIVESSDDAIIAETLDGIITSWNQAAERLYGWTSEEAIGRPISMTVPADRMEELSEYMGRVSRGDRVDHLETVRLRKDGARLDVSITLSPIYDEQPRS